MPEISPGLKIGIALGAGLGIYLATRPIQITEANPDNNDFTTELRVKIPGRQPFYLSREGTNYVPYIETKRTTDSKLERD